MWGDLERTDVKVDNAWMAELERLLLVLLAAGATVVVVGVPGHFWWEGKVARSLADKGSDFFSQLCVFWLQQSEEKVCRSVRVVTTLETPAG